MNHAAEIVNIWNNKIDLNCRPKHGLKQYLVSNAAKTTSFANEIRVYPIQTEYSTYENGRMVLLVFANTISDVVKAYNKLYLTKVKIEDVEKLAVLI